MNGTVYDWATVLADKIEEFMTLQHQTFFMPHHAFGLFLEATLHQVLVDDFEVPPRGKLVPGEPPVFYKRHLDMGGTMASQKSYCRG